MGVTLATPKPTGIQCLLWDKEEFKNACETEAISAETGYTEYVPEQHQMIGIFAWVHELISGIIVNFWIWRVSRNFLELCTIRTAYTLS